MKHFAIFLLMVCAFANAEVSPSEVDAAYNSGRYNDARLMLLDVAESHPSAKVHYRLGEVYAQEDRHADAIANLKLAQRIDPSLSFVNDKDLFRTTLRVEEQKLSTENQKVLSTITGHNESTLRLQSKRFFERNYTATWFLIILISISILYALHIYARSLDKDEE